MPFTAPYTAPCTVPCTAHSRRRIAAGCRAQPKLQVAKASTFTSRIITLVAAVYGLDVSLREGKQGLLLTKTERTAMYVPSRGQRGPAHHLLH